MKEVAMFQTKDGELFHDVQEAQEHERRLEMYEELSEFNYLQDYLYKGEVIDYILENFERKTK